MSNLSSQWRPLLPTHDCGSSNGGSTGFFNNSSISSLQNQQRRSVISKNSQNTFQNVMPPQPNNFGLNKMSLDYNNAPPVRERGTSPNNFNFSSSRDFLSSGSNRMMNRIAPSANIFGYNNEPSPSSNQQFDYNISNQRSSTASFDRSISLQDHSHTMVNGFGRQLSSSGVGVGNNSFDFRGSTSNGFGGSRSPPSTFSSDNQQRGSPMKIGTWNSVSPSSNASSSFPQITNNSSSSSSSTNNRSSVTNGGVAQSNGAQSGAGARETGIIEKLLHSYGFIQCCDRQARLFFHFSQFEGNIEHLKNGDPVEFEMTYDRRTGKPIASCVSKIAPEVVMSEERVIGTVTTEARIDSETGNPTQGRISYENRGECFFLPFTMSDVEGNVTVASGDKVSFQMATMQRSGNLVARTIRLENPAAPVKYQGVVNSIKESFGFIERADVVKEIFFHFSESGHEDIDLGDDVEFTIQTRNNKEVACNITKLESGTVIFEDVGTEYFKGQVLKPLDRNVGGDVSPRDVDPLPGRVKYRGTDRSEIEVPFGEKDQLGDFTLRHGDWVKFLIAIDRRDKLRRATKIELLDESFEVSDERREQGVIDECLDVNKVLAVGDECEFTVTPDPDTRFEVIIHKNVFGEVQVPPTQPLDTSDAKEGNGRIVYELNSTMLEIPLRPKDFNFRKLQLTKGDFVVFDINQLKSTKETNAVNVRLIKDTNEAESTSSTTSLSSSDSETNFKMKQGYVAALKDGFGFIETLERDKEIFFHFSNVEGKADKLEVGTEVEYRLSGSSKDKKISAEKLRVLSKGSIPPLNSSKEILNGKVIRTLRSVNPDQDCYAGLIQVRSEEGIVMGEYEYGIVSLVNKKELLQIHDPVKFRISECKNLALNVEATREKLRATVEAVKVDQGKKLFFHMSEVEAGSFLQQGDEVEFVVVTSKRTGKNSACCVKKVGMSKRPDRLLKSLECKVYRTQDKDLAVGVAGRLRKNLKEVKVSLPSSVVSPIVRFPSPSRALSGRSVSSKRNMEFYSLNMTGFDGGHNLVAPPPSKKRDVEKEASIDLLWMESSSVEFCFRT
ncbi:Cold shock domain-containing protein E1 [Lepeophtheirus salmonis]|uniref:Cold shock domain-containing protein E1 n=1 Tax=Lepeophtheirus salmonis TaxID=72036 RepID=A0A7R8D477_LEPSM|nr:Cold shock domain-containing protein E1 [Lepeophtheirus salmonis]CAF3022940.1 Cold shock domain-containing protein E1 [Lepeophtheirus salmonis]